MPRKFKTVKNMIKNLSDDKDFKKNALDEIEKKSLSKFLFTLRCAHNLTQKQLAEKIGCTQSRISKIESSYDENITIKDLSDYGYVLNLQLEIGYRNNKIKA